jgi:hypothetical protein
VRRCQGLDVGVGGAKQKAKVKEQLLRGAHTDTGPEKFSSGCGYGPEDFWRGGTNEAPSNLSIGRYFACAPLGFDINPPRLELLVQGAHNEVARCSALSSS